MSSIVSCSFSTAPPLPAPRTSWIFVRMFWRYTGRSLARFSICRVTTQPASPSTVNTSVTTTSTAGTRPTHRSSQVAGGVKTNVKRMASAKGTNMACAQYKTTTTSTHPANVTQGFRLVAVSFIVVWVSEHSIGRHEGGAPSQFTDDSDGAMFSPAQRVSVTPR